MQNKVLQNKMDALNALPGEAALNKDAAWQKLEFRLNKDRDRRPKAYWYRAAAVVALMIALPILLINRKHNDVTGVPTVQSFPNSVQAILPASTENSVSLVAPVTKKDDKSARAIILSRKNKQSKAGLKEIRPAYPGHKEMDADIAVPGVIAANAVLNDSNNISIVKTKKALPVVHINELDNLPAQLANGEQKQNSILTLFGNNPRREQAKQQEYTTTTQLRIPIKN